MHLISLRVVQINVVKAVTSVSQSADDYFHLDAGDGGWAEIPFLGANVISGLGVAVRSITNDYII